MPLILFDDGADNGFCHNRAKKINTIRSSALYNMQHMYMLCADDWNLKRLGRTGRNKGSPCFGLGASSNTKLLDDTLLYVKQVVFDPHARYLRAGDNFCYPHAVIIIDDNDFAACKQAAVDQYINHFTCKLI